MTEISYKLIIDDYDETSLSNCISLLYPLLGYRVLEEKDVRRVDLLEKLVEYQKNNLSNYATDVMFLLDNLFIYGEDTQQYYLKAKKDAEKIKKGNSDIEIAEDLAKIFISFARCYCENDKCAKEDLFLFQIQCNDGDNLHCLLDQKFRKKDKRKDVLGQKIGFKPATISERLLKYVYIITVLFWCRLNQFEGIETEEDYI